MVHVTIIGETSRFSMAGEAVEFIAFSDSFMANKNPFFLARPEKMENVRDIAGCDNYKYTYMY